MSRIKSSMVSAMALATLALGAALPEQASADWDSYGARHYHRHSVYHGNKTKAAVPEGMNGFLVYAANARVDIDDVVPVDGMNFHTNIMGRDAEEFEAVRQEAIDFFEERYGIENIGSNPDVFLRPYQVEPIANYRAYVVGGRKVPRRGWEVRDGGWELRVINPAGMVLGGEFDGEFVPPGAFMVYGDYNILACKNNRERYKGDCWRPEEIIIHYRSREPVTIAGLGLPDVITFSFNCEVFSEEFGRGLAQGIAKPIIVDGGERFQYNVRNVVTFTDRDGF